MLLKQCFAKLLKSTCFSTSQLMYTGGCDGGYAFKALHFFYLLHLHSPHISMQVMARAENTVFLRVEVKETNLEIFSVYAFTAKKISG